MNYFVFNILIFSLYHFIYIILGFIFYYVFCLCNIGHYLICMGLAPMFGYPKRLHSWVANHCPIDTNKCKCRRWTCPNYNQCKSIQ